MPYTVSPTAIPEVLIIEPMLFSGARGFFLKSFNQKALGKATGIIHPLVRDNHSQTQVFVASGTAATSLPTPRPTQHPQATNP